MPALGAALGWSLGRRLDAALATTALKMALTGTHSRRFTIQIAAFNTLRTSTQTCSKTTAFSISISRKGNPYDNAKAESFMKTLKYEQVYLSEYDSLS